MARAYTSDAREDERIRGDMQGIDHQSRATRNRGEIFDILSDLSHLVTSYRIGRCSAIRSPRRFWAPT